MRCTLPVLSVGLFRVPFSFLHTFFCVLPVFAFEVQGCFFLISVLVFEVRGCFFLISVVAFEVQFFSKC